MRGIGRTARESGLTVSALRFYDGAGVLVPAHVDPWSGYRYYDDDQVLAARLLARLRRVGMPLEDVRRVLDARRDPEVAGRILEAHLRRLEDGLADARRELSAARSLLAPESPMTAVAPTVVRIPAAFLGTALRAVRTAVGTDPDQPMLAGVLVEAGPDGVRVVATDRYRLAVRAVPGAAVDGPAVSALLPVALVDEVLDRGADGAAVITVSGDGVTVEVGGCAASGRRLDAGFPDYRRVLRPAGRYRVDVDAGRLRADVAAAPTRLVADETGAEHTVTVLRVSGDGGLSLGGDGGDDGGDDAALEVGVNREFLLQALDTGESGQLVLDLDGPIAPLVVRERTAADDSLHMLMPVRLP
jgi:DNA-binding transcriptional MerR regulator